MVVDASAVLAIYLREPDHEAFLEALTAGGEAIMSPINAWEVMARAHSVHGEAGARAAEALLSALDIDTPALAMDDVEGAVAAFARYGRPSQAGLNLGDCFAYALAARHGAPLLYKGADFAHTDIASAR